MPVVRRNILVSFKTVPPPLSLPMPMFFPHNFCQNRFIEILDKKSLSRHFCELQNQQLLTIVVKTDSWQCLTIEQIMRVIGQTKRLSNCSPVSLHLLSFCTFQQNWCAFLFTREDNQTTRACYFLNIIKRLSQQFPSTNCHRSCSIFYFLALFNETYFQNSSYVQTAPFLRTF